MIEFKSYFIYGGIVLQRNEGTYISFWGRIETQEKLTEHEKRKGIKHFRGVGWEMAQ